MTACRASFLSSGPVGHSCYMAWHLLFKLFESWMKHLKLNTVFLRMNLLLEGVIWRTKVIHAMDSIIVIRQYVDEEHRNSQI